MSKSNSTAILDELLKKHGFKRPVENKAFESVIKAEPNGCAAYEKAVLENKLTYNWVDADDKFDCGYGWTDTILNWTELLSDEKLVDLCVALAKKFFGGWACVTFQGEEKNSIHCVALFMNNKGVGTLKYNKLVDKASVNFEEQSQNEEMKE